MSGTLIIGSRGSKLALWQANHVKSRIEATHPEIQIRIEIIRTSGDKLLETSLAKIGGKGVFVKEIEEGLLEKRIDLAIHSLKDVPTELPEGLELGAILEREDPRDVLVSAGPLRSIRELPAGSRIGTGSLRRTVQLYRLRQDIRVEPIRGNVDTRIRKMQEQPLAAIVLAKAGLIRLGLCHHVVCDFALDEMTPAIGQGALAVEVRQEDTRLRPLLASLEDEGTRRCTEAERRFLRAMGGGCQVPMGAHARFEDGEATFRAFVAGPASGRMIRDQRRGGPESLRQLCDETIQHLLDQGAPALLEELSPHP